MNEVNRVKWARLRKILQNLEEPKNIEEIEKFVFTNPSKKNRRTLNNYLAELEAIGDIDYDATTQTYQKKGIRNRVFNSKHDFEYQLDHSKKLTQRLKTNPYFVLDLLAFASEEEDVEAFHLLKHIKTAYREIYTLIEKYRKKMIDAGLADYDGYPKPILSYEFPVPPPKGPIPRRLPMMLPEPDKETVLREQKEREKAQKALLQKV